MTTKCPYCRRRYQHAAAYENHVRTIHHDIMLFNRATASFASTTPSAGTHFVQDQALNQRISSRAEGGFGRGGGNSDYESDSAILGYN